MRVLIVDTYYPEFLRDHYARRAGLERRPYEEQLRSLLDRCFGTADAYSHHLEELGHESAELVVNCEPLQRRWAREHGVARVQRAVASHGRGSYARSARERLPQRIAEAQVESLEPDVVYVQNLSFFGASELERLRRRCRLLVGQCGSEPPEDGRLELFDLITTSLPHFVEPLRGRGIDTEYFRIGFYERVLERLRAGGAGDAGATRDVAVAFVGTVHPPRIHAGGTALLERLCSEVAMDVWGRLKHDLRTDSPLLNRYRGEAWGLEMYEVLARSRIAVNRHGDIADGYSINMRLYEVTGVGALLMTEASRNLAELFEPGREVVAYESGDDLVDKIRYYLEHDEERIAIAAAGQARTLREHTYRKRMEELVAMLEKRLA